MYAAFLGLGANAPFIATLGYVWVDTFQPQSVAYIILNQFPVAMIMGVAALGLYMLMDRRSPPRLCPETILQLAMAAWCTITMIWAEAPEAGWGKWDWAFKTLLFAAFLPYVIRSRVQIEAFAQIYVFALAANFVPFGLKTLVSGGGYGTNLGLQSGNSGLAEGGLLSTVCLMAVPLAVSLSQHTQLMPRMKLVPLGYWIVAGLAVVTAIGTYERSALIGLIILFIYMWIRSRHRVTMTLVGCVVGCLVVYTTSSAWNERVSTIGDFEKENSAYVRILVWRWTLGYTAEHPLGGGFDAFMINHIEVPGNNGGPSYTEFHRAYHSIYFEMLGEQGYPGIAMFLSLAILTFYRLHRTAKRARQCSELAWVASLSDGLQSGLAVFLSSGAFVGIAFQPMFWYFVSMSISLNAYLWRVEHTRQDASLPIWRAGRVALPAEPMAEAVIGGWRNRSLRR
jgi:probable O-glycosylation ligase (exosortase A-associated)